MSAVTASSDLATGDAVVPGSFRRVLGSRALANAQSRWGLGIVLFLVVVGLLGPVLAPADPLFQTADSLAPMSGSHLLGTDELGRDLFSRLLFGIRTDLVLAFAAVPIGAVLGTLIGLGCGLHRAVDVVFQRLFDMMLAFTAMVMGVVFAAILGPGFGALLWTIVGVTVPLFGRLTRDAVMAHRDRDYVVASGVTGAGPVRLLFRHILPNSVDALIVQFALSMAAAIFLEGAMSLIGLGIKPPTPSLGSLLDTGHNYLSTDPLYALGPILVVILLVLGLNLLADGLNKGLRRR